MALLDRLDGKINKYKQADKCKLERFPKSTQSIIDIKAMDDNGLAFLSSGKYSKTYLFNDLNFETEDEEGQDNILVKLVELYKNIPYPLKITINNKNYNMEDARNDFYLKENDFNKKKEDLKNLRSMFNHRIESSIVNGCQGIKQEKYITITLDAKKYSDARGMFNEVDNNLQKSFFDFSGNIVPLNATERIRILHDIFNIGSETNFSPFIWKKNKERKSDWRNDIVPYKIEETDDSIKIINGDRSYYCRVLFAKKIAKTLDDSFFNTICNLKTPSVITLDVVPIPAQIAKQSAESVYLSIERQVSKQQQNRNQRGDFSSDISYHLAQEQQEIKGTLDDLTQNDQSMYWVGINVCLFASTLDELNEIEEGFIIKADGKDCMMELHTMKQMEAFQTVLPVGVRKVETMRTLLSNELAILVPFYSQELMQKNGIFIGTNQITKNPVIANRKTLPNSNGWIYGESGYGKSTATKLMMLQDLLMQAEDTIFIIDPKSEYQEIIHLVGGTVIDFAPDMELSINPLDTKFLATKKEQSILIQAKSKLMLSLAQQNALEDFGQKHKSIIDRCVTKIYKDFFHKKTEQPPTMVEFYNELLKQKEEEAKDLAVAFEIFTIGSLNTFAKQSNVDLSNRLICISMLDLGEDLWAFAMMIVLDAIKNRLDYNYKNGIATKIWIDESHVLWEKEITADYFVYLWKIIRSLGGEVTGILQNISMMKENPKIETMLSNSEFILLLYQSMSDAKALKDLIHMTDSQIKYVSGARPGTGVLKFGKTIIPVDMTIDKDDQLYDLINTNFHEIHGRM